MNNYLLPIESKMEVFARTYSKDTGVSVSIGKSACTDGQKIYVPPIPDQADPFLRLSTEMFVYHETGHVIAKDAKTFEAYVKAGEKTKSFVFNIVRDVAVENAMETEYPGLAGKWTEFLTRFVTAKTNKEMTSPQTAVLRKLLITLYLRCRERLLGADFGLVLPNEIKELYEAKLAKFEPEIIKAKSVQASKDLTERIFTDLKEDLPEPKPKEKKDDKPQPKGDKSPDSGPSQDEGDSEQQESQDGSGDDGDPSDSSAEGSEGDKSPAAGGEEDTPDDPQSEKPGKVDEEGDEKGSKPSEETAQGSADGSEAPSDTSTGKDPNEGTPGDDSQGSGDDQLSKEAEDALKQAQKEMDKGDTGLTISEDAAQQINKWVETNKIYRDETGIIDQPYKQDEISGWNTEVSHFEEKGREMTGYVGKKMKVLFISEKAPVWQHNLRTGKLDCRKLHKLSRGSLEVCKRRVESVYEDSVVWLVIDHSGSMNNKSDFAQGLLTSLSSDLDKLRIPFGACGFTSSGEYPYGDGVRRTPCTLNMMKEFEEPYRRVRHRFIWPRYTSGTAEFPAIRLGAQRLVTRRETKKVLFVLTDGDTATGDDVLDTAMRKAMKEYVQRLLRAGMKVVGVGILDDSLKEYIPDFIPCNNLQTFAAEFYSKLTKLIL
jgi:nitric oxide reductase activation protein